MTEMKHYGASVEKSFRAILSEYLEPANAAPATAFAPSIDRSYETFESIMFTRPSVPNRAAHPRAYRRESDASRARAERLRQPRPEPVIEAGRLSLAARVDLEWMITHGAESLRDGLNARRLKNAYRTLAKRHHPDVNPGGHDVFIELRARYARLLQTCNSR